MSRRTMQKYFLLSILLLWPGAFLPVSEARGDEIIWNQNPDLRNDWGPSQIGDGFYPANSEIADDFDIMGTITRVDVAGYNSNQGGREHQFHGVYVRFYEYGADDKPGALQQEYFFPRGDPDLWVRTDRFGLPHDLRATLPKPFEAQGKHFFSVVVWMDTDDNAKWYRRSANTDNVRGQAAYYRDNSSGPGEWGHQIQRQTINSDVACTLWGARSRTTPRKLPNAWPDRGWQTG